LRLLNELNPEPDGLDVSEETLLSLLVGEATLTSFERKFGAMQL